MNQKNRLLTLGCTMRRYLDALDKTEKNIKTLGTPEHMSEYIEDNSHDYNKRLIKRDIRHAFEPLITFDEPEAKAMPVFFAASCFTQDWDSLLESISAVTLPDFSENFNVSSWGHIYPIFDINFIKQLRNAIAHSKFDYDFNEDKIYVSTYKDTFKVDFPSSILLGTPKTLWSINRNSTSKEAWVDCSFVMGDNTDKNLYTFFLKNGDTAHPTTLKALGVSDIKTVPLQDRIKIFEKFAIPIMQNEHQKSGESGLRRLKSIATQCGLILEYKSKFNVHDQTFKKNPFLEKLAKVVYHDKPEEMDSLFLRGAVMRPEKKIHGKSFLSYSCHLFFPWN